MAQYKLTGPMSAEDLTDRRKELIYCDGYDVTAGVTAFTAEPNNSEVDEAVFGQDDNITGTNTTSTTVGLTILEQNDKSNGFLRLIHGMKPKKNPWASPTQYAPRLLQPVNLLVLRKNNEETKIIASRFFRSVQFSEAYPEGNPDDKARRAFTGKGSPAREFDGLVTCETLASGSDLSVTPYAVPNEAAETYAVHIEALQLSGDELIAREPIITVTPTMISSTGTVNWTEIENSTSITVTHAHVYYLLSGVEGIPSKDPSIEPQGLFGVPD